jgi:hypothetical protein
MFLHGLPLPSQNPLPVKGSFPAVWSHWRAYGADDGIKMYLKEIGFSGLNFVNLTEDMDHRRDLVKTTKKLELLLSSNRGITLSPFILRPRMNLIIGKQGTLKK